MARDRTVRMSLYGNKHSDVYYSRCIFYAKIKVTKRDLVIQQDFQAHRYSGSRGRDTL